MLESPDTASPEPPLLEMHGIVKVFPGVRALDGVDLQVRAGEVHCLLGQNGAGKSTLIKVLAGAHQPDDGGLRWQGTEIRLTTPIAAVKRGIATIYQELDLIDGLSVAENIFLGHEISVAGVSRRGAMIRGSRKLLERLGHGDIPVTREVARLSSAHKQIVSMARALSHDAKLIIMDEPSAALDPEEVENLFRLIEDLRAHGVAVVYISHRMEEIRRIGDRITVLKDGRTVAQNLPVTGTATKDLIQLMTGRAIEYVFPARAEPTDLPDAAILQVSNISRRKEFRDISFTVGAGEIVGIAGLVGAGRSEVLETIYGARKPDTGQILIDGRRLRPGSVPAAVRAGVGLCPEERKAQGLLLDASVATNISSASMSRFARIGFVRREAERVAAAEQVDALDVRPPDPSRVIRTLSGGNQQKAILGRWLLRGCRVLLLDEPTRGVDVGARSDIYAIVRRLADSGVAVVVVSSEVEEVLGLADTVHVMADGQFVRSGPATSIDERGVLDLVMKGHAA